MSVPKTIASSLAVAALSATALFATAAPASARTHYANFSSIYYSSCMASYDRAVKAAGDQGRTIVSTRKCIQQPGSPYMFEGRVVSKD